MRARGIFMQAGAAYAAIYTDTYACLLSYADIYAYPYLYPHCNACCFADSHAYSHYSAF
jgi:hypothetical protein